MTGRVAVYVVVAACLLGLILYGIGQVTARLDAEDRAAIQADKAFVQLVQGRQRERRTFLAQIDSARAIAHRWHRIADARLAAADTVGQQADSAAASENWQVAYQRRTVEVMQVRASLAAKTTEATGLELALKATADSLVSAMGDVDSLTVRLGDANKRHECRVVGFLPCPSRTVVGVLGFAAGAVTVAAVSGSL